MNEIITGDCLTTLKTLSHESVDLLVTDPPYGYSFMGKDWDKAVPSVEVWQECLRVLKPGSFAFVMSAPRQDVLSQMIVRLSMAGFDTSFTSLYHTYASGFPKAMNMGKKTGKPELQGSYAGLQPKPAVEVIIVAMKPLSEKTYVDQALANGKGITWLDDCRIPYQNEDDFENAKGGDTAGDGRNVYNKGWNNPQPQSEHIKPQGRFPANLLVSDDVLNGEQEYSRYFDLDKWAEKTLPFLIVPKASGSEKNDGLSCYITVKLLAKEVEDKITCREELMAVVQLLRKVTSDAALESFNIDESGESTTALFHKDSLSTTLTRINRIIESRILPSLMHSLTNASTPGVNSLVGSGGNHVESVENLRQYLLTITKGNQELARGVSHVALRMLLKVNVGVNRQDYKNSHSTVKPLRLMSYLITTGSRPNDVILDPFCGSGTTCLAAKQLGRRYLGLELSEEYATIACKRLESVEPNLLSF